jgi:membrane protease YdiL (CAAX protease family)
MSSNLQDLLTRRPLLFTTLFYSLGFLLPALVLRALWFGNWWHAADLGPPSVEALLWAGAGLAGVLAATPWMMRFDWARRITELVHQVFGTLTPSRAAWLGLVSGLCEEMLFRGALQPMLGLLPASILFALAHMVGGWWIFALAMGLALGLLYQWSGNLWPCVLAHGLLNAINLYRMQR